MARYGSEYRHGTTANIFEGSFQDTRGDNGSKVIESAKDKKAGTAARARSKGGAVAAHNEETFNFKQPPQNQNGPSRTYEYKPASRNLLDCGNFEPEPSKATRKTVPPKEEKPSKLTVKRVTDGANSSSGIATAIKPDVTPAPANGNEQFVGSLVGGISRGGYSSPKRGRQFPWHPDNQDAMAKVGAPVRITDDKPWKSTKRVTVGGPKWAQKTDPWNNGKIQEPKQPDVEQRHKCSSRERKLHSFEADKKAPKYPGYKVTSPWGTDQ